MQLTPFCTVTLLTAFIMAANKFIEHIYAAEANCKDACLNATAAAARPSGVRSSESQRQQAAKSSSSKKYLTGFRLKAKKQLDSITGGQAVNPTL